MRVERIQHAVDRRLDELLIAHLLDILRADPLEHVAEQVELAVGVGGVCRLLRDGGRHEGQ
jgi:hypothetical protein